jgi:hypothetical protein
MTRRMPVALAAALSLVVSAVVAGPAMGAVPEDAKMKIVGGLTLVPGHHVKDDQRFKKRKNKKVQSGGSLTITNKAGTEDPHTFSIVNKSDRPDAPSEVFNCDACNAFFAAHDADGDGNPEQPTVNAGLEGFNEPGDSQLIGPPNTPDGVVTIPITAAPGTKLWFLCAVHPWMQGNLKVVQGQDA